MRVLYVIPAEGFGGAERQAIYHMKLLPRYGIDVVPLVGPGKLVVEQLKAQGIDNIEFSESIIEEYGRPYHTNEYTHYLASNVGTWVVAQQVLHHIVKAAHIDVIFASRATGWIMVGLLSRILNIPQVWRVGARPVHKAEISVLRLFSSLSNPSAMICNCKAVERSVKRAIHAPSWVIYNGVDTERFDPHSVKPMQPAELGMSTRKPVIVGVAARPAPGKGLENLAHALKLIDKSPEEVKVIIAGDYGWRNYYTRFFNEQGLGDQVVLIGHVQKVSRFLRSCDIVVLPSEKNSQEGLPNAILEAMAMERPVIGTHAGGMKEAIVDGKTGFLVSSGNPHQLAQALQKLTESPSLRKSLGHNARELVLNKFSLDESVRRISNVLFHIGESKTHVNSKAHHG